MSKERVPAIIGFGSAVPPRVVDNNEIAGMIGRSPAVVSKLMEKVGIKQRHWVETGRQATSDLSVEAIEQALKVAGVDKNQLKAIWVATFSPDYLGAPVSAMVQHKLGLPSNTRTCDIAVACPGWVQTLQISFADMTSPYGSGGPQAVVGAEVISGVLNPENPATFLLFGDAAGASITDLVIPDEGVEPIIAFAFGSDGKYAKDLCIPAGGSIQPTTKETVDNGMQFIQMNGTIVAEQAVRRMSELTVAVLEKAGIPKEEVNLFIPHQANKQIILATAEALNFPLDKVVINLDRMSNTSSATIPVASQEAFGAGRLNRNDVVLFVSFGAGMNFAAAVLRMVGLPKR